LATNRRLPIVQEIRTGNLPSSLADLRTRAIRHPRISVSATVDRAAALALHAFAK
jgi:hypothetical protein